AVGVGQGARRLATGLALGLPRGRAARALLARLTLRLPLVGAGAARRPRSVLALLGVEVLERALAALGDLGQEVRELVGGQVACVGVHGVACAAGDGDAFPRAAVQVLS